MFWCSPYIGHGSHHFNLGLMAVIPIHRLLFDVTIYPTQTMLIHLNTTLQIHFLQHIFQQDCPFQHGDNQILGLSCS